MSGRKQTDPPLRALEDMLAEANEAALATPSPAEPLSIDLATLTVEDAAAQVGALTSLATASLEYILRNPNRFPSQAVAAAKIVYERKLGAVPDTVIQNNMQFIVKWED